MYCENLFSRFLKKRLAKPTYITNNFMFDILSDSGKEKEALSNMKQVLEEQDRVMATQAQEIDERQSEIETLSTELQTWQDKCSFAEKEVERKKTEIANLKEKTLMANEENKRWDKMAEEIEKLKVHLYM